MTDIVERLHSLMDPHAFAAVCSKMEALHAESERLRAALQQIADDATPGDDNYCSDIARAALAGKDTA